MEFGGISNIIVVFEHFCLFGCFVFVAEERRLGFWISLFPLFGAGDKNDLIQLPAVCLL